MASALGISVGLSSYAISNEVRAPAKTLAVGVSPTAVASGNLALASLAARRVRNPRAAISPGEVEMARQAYRSEPLSVSAVALQALSLTGKSDAGRRQSLLTLAGKLTRRSTLVNMALIESAARRNDERDFFLWISRAMLINSEAGQAYGTAMADATARDGAVEALVDVLGPKPRWADQYWRLLVGRPDSLVNGARIRIALTRKPWRQTVVGQTDKDLVLGLARIGKFEEARQLANALRPAKTTKSNLLVNGDFAAEPALAPFDWQLSALGNLGASIDKGNKQLLISAVGGATGSAAQQLVQLAPGEYRLGWSMSSNAPLSANAIAVRIFCAEPNVESATRSSIALAAGKHDAALEVADGRCRWHWISIDVALPDDAPGVDAVVSGLSLIPAS
jgi:hypothetical protein